AGECDGASDGIAGGDLTTAVDGAPFERRANAAESQSRALRHKQIVLVEDDMFGRIRDVPRGDRSQHIAVKLECLIDAIATVDAPRRDRTGKISFDEFKPAAGGQRDYGLRARQLDMRAGSGERRGACREVTARRIG